MNICMIATSFPRSSDDYSGIFIFRLCKALILSGIKVDVVAPSGDVLPSYEVIEGCRIFRFRYFFPRKWQKLAYGHGGIPANLSRTPWLVLLIPVFLISFVWKTYQVSKGKDLIHAQWIYTGWVAWMVGTLRGIPFVITLRGSDVLYARKNRLMKSLSLWVLKRAVYITTVNRDLRDWLIAQGLESDRVLFIRNGVDLTLEKEREAESASCRLLFVGNLGRGKGIQYLIDALSLIPSSREAVRLTLIGEGEEREQLQRQAQKKGVNQIIDFVGVRPPEQIPQWMIRSDLLVLPSLSEGTPNVVLEAMASGLPVVASDLPGIREVVIDSETGLLVKPQDTFDLAEKLTRLIQNKDLRQQMGKKGRQAIIEMGLSWDRVAGRYREVYQKTCAASRGSSI